jgi:hypothetical protein
MRAGELSRHVTEICYDRDMEPADMASPSRRAFQLLSFFASSATWSGISRPPNARPGGGDSRVFSRLDHIGALYRIERHGESIRLVASEGFVGAPESVLRALIQVATPYARKQRPRREIRDYVDGPRYSETLRRVEEAGGAYRSRPQGNVHDLRELFDRVNGDYFGGELTPPRLLWSERVPSVEFGHYEPATDTIRLSQRLDSPDVPGFVLEHVMHHELLHRAWGRASRRATPLSSARSAKERRFEPRSGPSREGGQGDRSGRGRWSVVSGPARAPSTARSPQTTATRLRRLPTVAAFVGSAAELAL